MTDKTVELVRWGRAETASADVVDRIGPGTAAVTVSHVDTRTGVRHDLAALAAAVHAVGGVLIVDVAQSAGVVPIDVNADDIGI